jgi:hypothetical protein
MMEEWRFAREFHHHITHVTPGLSAPIVGTCSDILSTCDRVHFSALAPIHSLSHSGSLPRFACPLRGSRAMHARL